MLGDADSLALVDQMREIEEPLAELPTPAKRGRKRKIQEDPVCCYLVFYFILLCWYFIEPHSYACPGT